MAIDHAIMEAVGRGEVAPTLRFYRWNPPCLSLGYGQPLQDVDLDRIRRNGWDLVRRITGGRAILHTDELTYSIAFPQSHPLVQGSILESYRRLSAALVEGLRRLNLPVATQPAAQKNTAGAVCFEVPSDYEITAGGKKLVGSAQARRFSAVLQHGSLPLWGDIARICDALAFPDETERENAKRRVRARATTVEAVAGSALSWEIGAEILAHSFAETFGVRLEPGELSANERSGCAVNCREIYENESWNARH